MTTLFVTVLLASLTGSLHCAGMCGAFVLFSVGADQPRGLTHAARQSAYHGGRLVTYALLGALAGLLGSAVDVGGAAFGLRRGAMVLAGAAMVAFGAISLLRWAGLRIPAVPLPAGVTRLYRGTYRKAQSLPGLLRPLVIGLLSTLLPCGWLYAFVVTASGTGSAALGALVMAAFWLGTVPVLAGIGLGVQKLAGPLRRTLPAAAALAIIVVGMAALLGRLQVPDPATAPPDAPTCHTAPGVAPPLVEPDPTDDGGSER